MPSYDFRCPKCNSEESIFRGITDTSPVVCPSCGSPMNKLVGAPSFKFTDPRGTCGRQATGYTKIRHS